jgi:hypothetical protein
MRTNVWLAATALILAGLATGCERTTEGSVALTTQPGPPLTTTSSPPPTNEPGFQIPGLPGITIPNIPGLPGSPDTSLPEVPPPAGALTMKCSEYSGLDDATKLAVVKAILAEKGSPLGPGSESISKLLADTMCQLAPDEPVSQVVAGGG